MIGIALTIFLYIMAVGLTTVGLLLGGNWLIDKVTNQFVRGALTGLHATVVVAWLLTVVFTTLIISSFPDAI